MWSQGYICPEGTTLGHVHNLLAPGHLVDTLSGNAVVNGIPVEVAPVG